MFKEEELKRVEEFFKFMAAAIKNHDLYPKDNPMIMRPALKAYDLISQLLLSIEEIPIALLGKEIIVAGKPIPKLSSFLREIAEEWRKKKVEMLIFYKGLKKEEFKDFIEIFHRSLKSPSGGEERQELSKKGIQHIKTKELKVEDQKPDEEEDDKEGMVEAKMAYKKGIEVLKMVLSDPLAMQREQLEASQHVVGSFVDLVLKDRALVSTLLSLKKYDAYTFTHSMNLCILILVQGESLGLDDDELRNYGLAAFFHDIGKTNIPESIINKAGKLTEEEFDIIKQHPVYGAKILMKMADHIGYLPAIVAFEHHRKYNFTGYPNVEEDKDLHLSSMLTTIADVYDALRSIRPYRGEMPPDKVFKVMEEGEGKDFHPGLLYNFLSVMGSFPRGTFVKLNTGETALVMEINPDNPWRPKVKKIFDAHGTKILEPVILDLSEHEEISVSSSLNLEEKGLDPSKFL
jgi:HD-GYP domain-containing protein (c-di-GMP phosphodiesterase class II)